MAKTTEGTDVGMGKKSGSGKLFWIIGGIIALALIVGAAIQLGANTSPATEDKKLTGFAFAAIGPASTIPQNAHNKVVSASASERYAVTLDATTAGIKGLKFKEWHFGDGGYNPSPKTGFCLPSNWFKPGEEMKIKAIAVDGQGKTVEDEIKIIFR